MSYILPVFMIQDRPLEERDSYKKKNTQAHAEIITRFNSNLAQYSIYPIRGKGRKVSQGSI